ncbi:MAG: chromosomal replication initiator protein DnaA [Caulobacteraceae bacterium]|nr:chromosomal replication initiator protein DnaA [Caulobacter sp.]
MQGLATGRLDVETQGAAGQGEGAVWLRACADMRSELGDAAYGSYLAPARLRRGRAGRLVVVTPTGVARDWVRKNAWRRLSEVWSSHDPQHRALLLKTRSEFEVEDGGGPVEAPRAPDLRLASHEGVTAEAAAAEPPLAAARLAGVSPRHTFEGFVSGTANAFALSAARKVAEWKGGAFNPVVFHSPYGFGKTHLLQAIAQEAQARRPEARVVYLGGERFMNGYVRAVMERAGPAFKEELRAADLLIIDDVQFLAGKKGSQEELFHTLTALMGEGRPVVFACDRHPSQLAEMEARLRSHLCAGLVCGIEPYDTALRLGVLDRKLHELAEDVGCERTARTEVMQFLADRFVDSVRELEGGLKTLVARAGERLSQLSLDEASSFLRPHLKGAERRVTVDEIQKATCEHYRLKQADLLSERRTRAVARPRQVAMFLCKQLTTRSYPDIGRRFGNRDHTTVLHAVRQIEKLKAEDPTLAADVEALTRKLRE